MRRLLICTLVCVALICGGCATLEHQISKYVVTKSAAEKQVEAVKADYATRIDAKAAEIGAAKDAIIKAKDAQMDSASGSLWAITQVQDTIKTPARTDYLIRNYSQEGFVALGSRTPSAAIMATLNKRIADELDETKTSLAQLDATHKAALTENQRLVDAAKVASDKEAALEKALSDLRTEKDTALAAAQAKLNEVNDQLIAAEKARGDDAKARQAALTKVSTVAGALSLLCLAAAIWLPIWKDKAAIGAGVFALAAVGVWMIQPWMVGAAVGVAVLGIAGWAVYEHNKASSTAQDVYRAVNEFKTKASDKYNADLKPILDSWLVKYVKNGATVPNTAATDHIDTVLKKAGDL